MSRSPSASAGGASRCSVTVRKSPAPNTIAENVRTSFTDSDVPAGEPYLDRVSCRDVAAGQACRQRRRIVGDDEIAAAEERKEVSTPRVVHMAERVDDQQLRIARTLHRFCSSDHMSS